MNQQNKSTPKMRRAFTPRVKSAQMIHQNEPNQALFFTDKKIQNNNMMNPQKINNHISKKLNLNIENHDIHKKVDLANVHTDTDSPVRQNNFIQKHIVARNYENNKNKHKIQNRIKQWPNVDNKYKYQNNNLNIQNQGLNQHENGEYNQKQIKHNKQQQFTQKSPQINNHPSRCMSAQTFRTVQSMAYSQKSTKIKQHKKEFQQKFNVAFNYLLRSNSQYLGQKLSMCNQKARPKQQNFKVKRPSINTTNKDFYKVVSDKHKIDIQPQNQKMSLLLSNSKVCGNSLNQEIHSGRQGKRADLATWGQGFKLQGPIYSLTTNNSAYPHHGSFDKMVPIAVWNEHPLGMKHKQTSTNSKFFKGQHGPKANLATWNNLNPIANDLFNPQNDSYYSKQFCKKQRQGIQQWPMAEHKLIVTNGKFSTQMKESMVNFNQHELNVENKCNCGRKRH